ncbi:MAG: hypothetical protein IPP07_27505 [Holophagales bacterium]|nr:hypothetical protein [Holophagales bacterium]
MLAPHVNDPLDSFHSATAPEERVDAFVRLIHEARGPDAGPGPRSPIGAVLDAVEASPERREQFLASLSALLAETDGTALFGDVGIPSDRGFLAELGDRISTRLIPSPRDSHDLSEIVYRLFRSDSEVEGFRDLPLSDVHRLVRLVGDGISKEAASVVSGAFADGFRLLLGRLQAHGLSRDLRARSTPGPVYSSPFHRVLDRATRSSTSGSPESPPVRRSRRFTRTRESAARKSG